MKNIYENSKNSFVPLEGNINIFAKYYINSRNTNSYMSNPHFHDQYEFVYIKSGSIFYDIGDYKYRLQKGDFALITPYVMHFTERNLPFEMYVINFTKAYIDSYFTKSASENILSAFSYHVYRNNISNSYTDNSYILKRLFEEFSEAENSEENSMCPYLLAILLKSVIKYSKADIQPCKNNTEHIPIINLILKYINQEFSKITKLEQVSDYFYISKFHLCKIFKAETNCTVMQYINDLKIKNAKELLKDTDFTVSQISEACGFESLSYFSKSFKARTGYSPVNYRARFCK